MFLKINFSIFEYNLDREHKLSTLELKKLYSKIEKFIFKNIKNAQRIDCDIRFSNTSEWFYTSQEDIFEVFDLAQQSFNGDVEKYEITDEIFEMNESDKCMTTMTIRF